MPASRPRVLVTHTVLSSAESLTTILANCRPDLCVSCLAPHALAAALTAEPGAIVVTDQLTPTIARHAAGWLLVYPSPDDAHVAVLGAPMGINRISGPSYAEMVAAIDRLVSSPSARRPGPPPTTPAGSGATGRDTRGAPGKDQTG